MSSKDDADYWEFEDSVTHTFSEEFESKPFDGSDVLSVSNSSLFSSYRGDEGDDNELVDFSSVTKGQKKTKAKPLASGPFLNSSSECSSDSESSSQQSSSSFQNGVKRPVPRISKDGMAVCERCGTVGVKHAFYSKTKRFCSLACSRGLPKPSGGKVSSAQVSVTKRLPPPPPPFLNKPKSDLTGSFDWKTYLNKPDFSAAPVSSFKHVALADCWDNITVGMKIEVENRDCDNFGNLFPSFYWIASVVKIAGYMALLRYEGFGLDDSKDFWVNLCLESIHPVGWCASQGKPLIPPKTIEHKHADWKEFLVKRLTGARTLPSNFHAKVQEGLRSKFRVGMKLEVVDKNRISSIRVARVQEVVGGRLHVAYEDAEKGDEGFWCHERSPLIHPIGWAQVVGHDLRASL
ncbi:polycomb protein Sfmbt-like, partial [Limulus polyphemus]|uniref:Polycomb protein Sfmbt-like n=1 Tax=Limulus polyphemus TaxID=6850 RepID=A0ABM1TQB7_LIMPO